MSLRRASRRAPTAWIVPAEILRAGTYEERLDGVLRAVAEATGHADGYLYLPDASGRRLRLERSLVRAPEIAVDDTAGLIDSQVEGGAGWAAPSPPLELQRSDQDEVDRVVETPVGPLHSSALIDVDGTLAGLVQTGPLGSQSVPRDVRERLDGLRAPLAFVVEQARAAESTRRGLAEATARLEATHRLAGSALDVDQLTRLLLDLALSSTGTEAGFVAIQPQPGGGFEIRAQSGMPEGFEHQIDLSPQDGMFDWSPTGDGGGLILADFEAAARLGIRSLLAVPLIEAGEPLGIFTLVNFGASGTFDETSLELCAAFAEQIRLMLQNARVFNDFAKRYLETVVGLARALDTRTPATRGHHERVSDLAITLAGRLGVGESERDALRTAALIHDIGLAAAGNVADATEFDIDHPTVGAMLVEHLPIHPAVAAGVATHHEWYDGWGFPRGLAAEQIPLGGRILAMAEFLVEMSTDSPVRPAWTPERLAGEIAQRRGTQFDPAVADAARELLRAGRLETKPHSVDESNSPGRA